MPGYSETLTVYSFAELGRAATITKSRDIPPWFLHISSEVISPPLVSVEENKLIVTESTVAVLN
jgi:hypothetical protein